MAGARLPVRSAQFEPTRWQLELDLMSAHGLCGAHIIVVKKAGFVEHVVITCQDHIVRSEVNGKWYNTIRGIVR